jgi:hypothetical protein
MTIRETKRGPGGSSGNDDPLLQELDQKPETKATDGGRPNTLMQPTAQEKRRLSGLPLRPVKVMQRSGHEESTRQRRYRGDLRGPAPPPAAGKSEPNTPYTTSTIPLVQKTGADTFAAPLVLLILRLDIAGAVIGVAAIIINHWLGGIVRVLGLACVVCGASQRNCDSGNCHGR